MISFFCLALASVFFVQGQSRFALLTDIHVTPGTKNEASLIRIADEINADSGLDFVVVSGDLTNMGSDEELVCVKSVLDRIRIPVHVIPGNHESNWSQSACLKFNELWGNDRFLFRHNGGLFIGLSTGPYMKMGDGNVKREDILWLDETLKREAVPGTRVYVVAHYPLMDGLSNYKDVLAVLNRYPVITQFCGHHHQLRELDLEGMKGIIGRAMFTDDERPGYNLVTLTSDSVFYFEKVLGEQAEQRFAFANDNKKELHPVDLAPPVPVDLALPSDTELTLVYEDHASLYSGVSTDKSGIYWVNSLGEVQALSKKGKSIRWSFPTTGTLYSTPVCSKGKLVVPATDGNLYGLDAKSGKVCWSISGKGPFVADGLADGSVVYQGGYKCFYKVDARNGRILWKSDLPDNYSQARPALSGNRLVFGVWDTYLYCLDANTGNELWRWSNGGKNRMLSPGNCVPAVLHDRVYVVAPDRYMTAIDLSSGRQLWRNRDFKYRESMGYSADGKRVYAKTMDGELVAVSAESSDYKLLWCVDAKIGYEHTPSPVVEHRGVVYFGSRLGIVSAVDAATGKLLWRKKCGNSAVNRFDADADGSLYFTLIEGKIFKITVSDR